MENIYLIGTRLEDLLNRIEQIIDNRLKSLAPIKEESPEYLTRKETAYLLKITLPTLHDWTKQGWLLSYRIGKRVLYKKNEVENAIREVNFYKHKKGGMK